MTHNHVKTAENPPMNDTGTCPAISVVLCVHNSAAFVEASIRSVLAQTFSDFEFIIVDDGSTDNTPHIVDALAAEDERIRVFHRKNVGLTVSLGFALQEARGIWIARQDDDDLSLPDRFRLQKEFLETHPSYAVVGCRYKSIDKDGNFIGRSNVPLRPAAVKRALLTHNVIAHSGAMFHREKILGLGGYDTTFRTAQDYELWCRAALHFDLGNLKDVLLYRRCHENQIGVTKSASQIQNRNRIRRAYQKAVTAGNAASRLPLSVRLSAKLLTAFARTRET